MKSGGVVILGAGGHARVVITVLRQMGCLKGRGVLVDDNYKAEVWQPLVGGLTVVGPITPSVLAGLAREGFTDFIVGIGSVNAAGCALRDKLYQMALGVGLKPIAACSPTAAVLGHLGQGVFVGPWTIVMPGAIVGANSIINTGAIVEHDCRVGWSSHIATGAVLCGGVIVGNGVHVGAGAVVKQGVTIGDGATIGMGAVVLEDVAEGETVVGNPARVLV